MFNLAILAKIANSFILNTSYYYILAVEEKEIQSPKKVSIASA